MARYFGGIKLGTGGLGRAYRDAAAAALEKAQVTWNRKGAEFGLDLPYTLQKTLRRPLDAHRGVLRQETFGESIRWRIWLPAGEVERFSTALESATNGAIRMRADP